MAKIKTECGCGGSFDGTPSGESKHIATAKHIGWVVGERKAAKAEARADATTPRGEPQDDDEPTVGESIVNTVNAILSISEDDTVAALQAELTVLITDKEQELARRQIDHKYRERHSAPTAAQAYFDAKVVPLKAEIDTLRAARKALGS